MSCILVVSKFYFLFWFRFLHERSWTFLLFPTIFFSVFFFLCNLNKKTKKISRCWTTLIFFSSFFFWVFLPKVKGFYVFFFFHFIKLWLFNYYVLFHFLLILSFKLLFFYCVVLNCFQTFHFKKARSWTARGFFMYISPYCYFNLLFLIADLLIESERKLQWLGEVYFCLKFVEFSSKSRTISTVPSLCLTFFNVFLDFSLTIQL